MIRLCLVLSPVVAAMPMLAVAQSEPSCVPHGGEIGHFASTHPAGIGPQWCGSPILPDPGQLEQPKQKRQSHPSFSKALDVTVTLMDIVLEISAEQQLPAINLGQGNLSFPAKLPLQGAMDVTAWQGKKALVKATGSIKNHGKQPLLILRYFFSVTHAHRDDVHGFGFRTPEPQQTVEIRPGSQVEFFGTVEQTIEAQGIPINDKYHRYFRLVILGYVAHQGLRPVDIILSTTTVPIYVEPKS
jgi:hypothetical protein